MPGDISEERLQKIRQLMPYLDPHLGVSDLVSAFIHPPGEVELAQPVQNRPWEWTEFLGDPPTGEGERATIRHLVRNTAALSLDLFDASGTGECIPISMDGVSTATLRTFHDNVSSESVYARSWRDNRQVGADVAYAGHPPRSAQELDLQNAPAWVTSMIAGPTFPAQTSSRPGSRGTSPASSVHSRTSFVPPSGVRASPTALRGPSAATPQTVGTATGTRRASKRKALQSFDVDDDDDIQIIDHPPAASTSQGVKPKPRPAGKGRTQFR